MTTTVRILSPQQEVVRNFPRTHTGSAFAEAVAGAGKTTTAMFMIAETTGSVGVMAYNKSAALEFDAKARELGFSFGNRVRFGTVHSFGCGAVRYVYKNVKMGPEAARQKTDMMIEKLVLPRSLYGFVPQLISLAKQRAIGLYGSIDDQKLYYDIVEHFDLDYEIEDPGLVKAGIEYAIEGLKWHKEMGPEIIDFDDMIWLPIVTNMRMWQNDWIVGDEWQDANPARRALARKMLKPRTGRALFIGDRHQAIYGFTGADNDSIDQTIRDFNCIELPMTVSFRCPKAVVAKAREVVAHIEAHENAPEGAVFTIPDQEFSRIGTDQSAGLRWQEFDQINDAVLCRNTKPLVKTAFNLIKRGIPCHVEGRDIGAGLIKLVDRFVKARSMDTFRDRITAYRDQQSAKLIAKGKETQAQAIEDRVDTILVIAEAVKSVEELKTKIASMFQDSDGENRQTLCLATIHKSKGREWYRVFILGYDQYMPSPYARQEWQLQQERNLQYVGVTRAKHELVIVDVQKD